MTTFTTFKWRSLVNLLKNCPLVGHSVSKGRVAQLVFTFDNGNRITVPAGCRDIEIHVE